MINIYMCLQLVNLIFALNSDLNLISEALEMMGMSGKLSLQAQKALRTRLEIIDLELEAAEKRRQLAAQGLFGSR